MGLNDEFACTRGAETSGKYDGLRDHLAQYGAGDQLRLSFGEVEELVGSLPLGARRLRQWWANGSQRQAQAWRAVGWRVLLVDMGSQQVLFERYPGREPVAPPLTPSEVKPRETAPPSRGYLAEIHVLLIVVLVILSVIFGAIGVALRPGTDAPPAVSDNGLTLYVYQQKSATALPVDPAHVSVDEVMMQENSSTVLIQIDVFAAFARSGVARWRLATSMTNAQPYACPDAYRYLGTAQPDPFVISNGHLVIGSQPATRTIVANFVGRRSAGTAANVLELDGKSPGGAPAGQLAPVAGVDLCWTGNLPMAFDGEFASAALPAITAVSLSGGSGLPVSLTRSLYFENKLQPHQPITAEYSLQAGTLPTSTDPFGWHWSGSQPRDSVHVTAVDIPLSQHEAYLGFVSGVLFGVVGGAVVLILQELLEPIRLRRRTRNSARAYPYMRGDR